jgi:hypothetical protein
MANVHDPFVGFAVIWAGTQGHTKSQLQFSQYCPSTCHVVAAMSSPPAQAVTKV